VLATSATLIRRQNLLLVIGVARNGKESYACVEEKKSTQEIYTVNSCSEKESESSS
jgi:adenosyl cobinamide kinase/adenosyl cobinamide phosphate guanylyltransferase